jgi:hypothetical protein
VAPGAEQASGGAVPQAVDAASWGLGAHTFAYHPSIARPYLLNPPEDPEPTIRPGAGRVPDQLLRLEKAIETVERHFSSPATAPVGDRPAVDPIVASQQEGAEAWLREHVPVAAAEMSLAAERIAEAAENAGHRRSGLLAQGALSLRRVLRALADELSPPHPDGAVDPFGKECSTDESKYLSRLHLALAASRDANGLFEQDRVELDLLHRRLTKLNGRLASGIHGSGSSRMPSSSIGTPGA